MLATRSVLRNDDLVHLIFDSLEGLEPLPSLTVSKRFFAHAARRLWSDLVDDGIAHLFRLLPIDVRHTDDPNGSNSLTAVGRRSTLR